MGFFDFFKSNNSTNSNANVINSTNKSDYVFFEKQFNYWKESNKELLYDSSKYYKDKCCPECGSYINQELKTSFICNECKHKIITRTNPENKEKVLILETDKSKFDKEKQKLKELKTAEQQAQFIIEFYPNYRDELLKQIESKPNYEAIDIVYHFQNDVVESEKRIAMSIYSELKQTNSINFDNAHRVTDRLISLYVLSEHNMQLLFLQKKYNVLVSYLPILLYQELTNFVFIYNLLHYQYSDDDIITSGASAYLLVLDLFKESDYTIKDLKNYYFDVVKEGLGFIPIDKKVVWNYIEKGINDTIKYRKKMENKNNK